MMLQVSSISLLSEESVPSSACLLICAQVDGAGNPLVVGPPASTSLANTVAATTTAVPDLHQQGVHSSVPGNCSSTAQNFKDLTATQRR